MRKSYTISENALACFITGIRAYSPGGSALFGVIRSQPSSSGSVVTSTWVSLRLALPVSCVNLTVESSRLSRGEIGAPAQICQNHFSGGNGITLSGPPKKQKSQRK